MKEELDYYLNREKKILDNYNHQEGYEDWNANALSKNNQQIGFIFFLMRDIERAKQYFSNVGNIDIYLVREFKRSHSRFLDYDLQRCIMPILSDNKELIDRYSKIRYTTLYQKHDAEEVKLLDMDEMVAIGESPIWCNTVQFFMANDKAGIERNLNILETITLKKLPKREELLVVDYNFYKALYERDKNKIEETLAILVSPKIHKKRNDNPILNQYISLPALGYAKLAWRYGIEVKINSALIPQELLPIQPLTEYEIPYDFLK